MIKAAAIELIPKRVNTGKPGGSADNDAPTRLKAAVACGLGEGARQVCCDCSGRNCMLTSQRLYGMRDQTSNLAEAVAIVAGPMSLTHSA